MPIFFYLTYIHFGNYLKITFNYSSEQVISYNFILGIIYLFFVIVQTYLCYKVHPLKIIRVRVIIFTVFLCLYPYLLSNLINPMQLLIFQACIMTFAPTNFPAVSIFFVHFPIFKRFTIAGVLHAVSHAIIYTATSFGVIYLVKYFGQMGVLYIVIPIHIGFIIGLRHFEKLEKKEKNYLNNDIAKDDYLVQAS